MRLKIVIIKIKNYFLYHFYRKWNFVYLDFDLEKKFTEFKPGKDIQIKEASINDLDRIKLDLFPEMVEEQEYEKKYFEFLGDSGVKCIICLYQDKIIHYSWLFLDVKKSAITKTPFNQRLIKNGDVYIGPIFTKKSVRGFIYPQVLTKIIASLVDEGIKSRILVLVQGLNPAAVGFYKKMGFEVIANPTTNSFFPRLVTFLNKFLVI